MEEEGRVRAPAAAGADAPRQRGHGQAGLFGKEEEEEERGEAEEGEEGGGVLRKLRVTGSGV